MKLCLYSLWFQATFKQLSSTAVLPFNEPVEAMDYDSGKCKLVLTSHTAGKIKLFHEKWYEKIALQISKVLKLFRKHIINLDQKLEWDKRGGNVLFHIMHILPWKENISQLRSWIWNAVSQMLISDGNIINMGF